MARKVLICTAKGCCRPRPRGKQFCMACFLGLPPELRDRVARAWALLHRRDKTRVFAEARKWLATHTKTIASPAPVSAEDFQRKAWWND